jgi:hypothetical protein
LIFRTPVEPILRAYAPADRVSIVSRLDEALPRLWHADYLAMPGSTDNLVTVTFGDETRAGPFCRYLFDHSTDPLRQNLPDEDGTAEDRVVAVWGTSREPDSRARDKARMRGFPLGPSAAHDDRGHFFAHTMGGGLDINLFPQTPHVNRRGLWRKMETYCSQNPGTFSFIRPIYVDTTWRPARLEYGIVKLIEGKAPELWSHLFDN